MAKNSGGRSKCGWLMKTSNHQIHKGLKQCKEKMLLTLSQPPDESYAMSRLGVFGKGRT